MVRLFDLHALSCAGDTLIAIGLAGTIFFNVPLGEARSKVALYLLVTMVPFAHAGAGGGPAAGPLPPRPAVRAGRHHARPRLPGLVDLRLHRTASGSTRPPSGCWRSPGRTGWPARRPCPGCCRKGSGSPRSGARASVYGTVAGALVAPIGLAAFWFGPQWPLRVAVGDLPGRHGDRPAAAAAGRLGAAGAGAPSAARRCGRRGGDRPLGRGRPAGRLVIATLIGAAAAPRGLRLPAALPRLRDQGRRPDHRWCSAGTWAPRRRSAWSARALAVGHLPGHRRRHPAAHPPAHRPAVQQHDHRGRGGGARHHAVLAADGRPALPGHRAGQRAGEARRGRLDPGAHPGTAAGQFLRPLRDGADARLRRRRRPRAGPVRRPGRASPWPPGSAALAAIRGVLVAGRLRGETPGRPAARPTRTGREQEREAADEPSATPPRPETQRAGTRHRPDRAPRVARTSAPRRRRRPRRGAGLPRPGRATALDDDAPAFHIYRPSPVGGARPGADPPGQDPPGSALVTGLLVVTAVPAEAEAVRAGLTGDRR